MTKMRSRLPALLAVLLILAAGADAAVPAVLNQRMATRSGPGTKYTEELGTLPQDTPITLIEYVTTGGTPWGMVEFFRNGLKYRAYTGMKRIIAYGPVPQGSESYTDFFLPLAAAVYYGPGYDYAQRQEGVPAGTWLRVLGSENGFALCDYQSGGQWVRGYLPGIMGGSPPYVPGPAYAFLNQRMATRSGPGTKYTEELGTLPQNTPITLIEYVTTGGTPWGLVEFYKGGQKYRAYTGMKRITASGPVPQGTLDYFDAALTLTTDVYYGPGYDYARRGKAVFAGTPLRVYGFENGFALCDYQSGSQWVRAYFPGI